ncbi:MAG: protein kinase, partial [Bacteroidota bacterium]
MINHRYRIINELGAGGSGRVFLVEDILWNHAPRALKVLTNLPVPVPGGEDPFLTETSILLSLHHPHLVSLYDFDTVRQAPRPSLSGCRFFTMEYVKGLDALNWVIGIPPGPDRTRTIRTLLAQCLSVLSYVHERGIIHSDIKPQNLLVSGEPLGAIPPVVKLTDFGFSRTEAASSQASARGTLEYDAPEVLRGETVDQRIDLYSVGATFYHLVEGHCPFESTDPVALIKKILTDDPAFASPLWSEMPAMLAVVQSLLKKDPKDRPSTAHEAFSMLGVEELADQESDAVKQLIVPFVGREAELRRIRSIVRGEDSHTGSERPTAILITGLEGMGKSRLLDEVIRTARISGLRVFAASAVGGGIPYSGVRSLLRTLNVEIRSFADFDGASLPEGSRIVERYLEESDATKDSTDVFRPRDRDATVEALARFVIGCASRIPMTLVADDLDAMDENSVQVLQTIARDMPPGRATLVATSAADSVWTHAAPRVVRLPLTDLALADVISLAHSVLGRNEAVEALGTRLREVLGGMPIVILEALRALQGSVNAEYLCKNIETALTVIDRVIPSDADKLLLNRFSGLTPEKRLLFAFLCCFELPAPVAFAERYLALHPARIRTSLHDMKAAGLIAFNEDESRVAVSIARLKRVVYESLGADRMNLHRMIVAGMDAFSVEPSIPDLQEMAHQYNEMGEPDKASKYLERAAVRVLSLQAYQRALDLISRAIEAAQTAADPDRVMALQGWRADALLQAGRIKEAIDLGTSVLTTMSIPEELRHSLLRTVSLGRSRLGDFELAKEGLRELIAAARNEGERAELVQELVNIEINVGGFKKAEETCLAQLEVAEQLENDKLKGAIFTDLG